MLLILNLVSIQNILYVENRVEKLIIIISDYLFNYNIISINIQVFECTKYFTEF